MKNLQEHIAELNQEDWDYYYPINGNHIGNPFTEQISHENFIKRYFKRGGKEKIFKSYFNVKSSFLKHSKHTNSIFFLGILIRKYTKLDIKNQFNTPGYSLFPFLWFLACLFHDMGYDYEEIDEYKNQIWDIDSLKKELKIKFDFSTKNIKEVPKTILKNISKYYVWKRFVRNSLDHGIVAGYYLYDKLVKNRKYRLKQNNNELFWQSNLDDQYAEVAALIASHNIWFANSETEESYRTFQINELIGHSRINYHDFPMFFLLGLVDSIDPIKTFIDNSNNVQIIDNLKIDFSKTSMSFGTKSLGLSEFEKLKKKCEDLELWLDVNVKVERNLITIIFNDRENNASA